MNDDIEKLFVLRWEESITNLRQEFLQIKQEMTRRGLLNSSITVQNCHKALSSEFDSNRLLISRTIIDWHKSNRRPISRKDIDNYSQSILSSRKEELENTLKSELSSILQGLQNAAMTAQFLTLDKVYLLAQKELAIELSNSVDDFEKSLGKNLTERLRNKFLNNPIIAVAILSFAGASFIISVLKLLGIISFR